MPQSLSQILVHGIFSTKKRVPYISDQVRPNLHAYMGGIFRDCNAPCLEFNTTFDHVHTLFVLPRTLTIANLLEQVKKGSSHWMKGQARDLQTFQWQSGYGVFSIGQSQVADLRRYIVNQQEHHLTRSFQDEYRAFLVRYEVEYDERYVWD